MSPNSSILRRAAAASSPSPSTAVSSGGVVWRHTQRTVPRRTPATTVTTNHVATRVLSSTGPGGVSDSTSPSIAVPAATQAAITDISSKVRWRMERWSRS